MKPKITETHTIDDVIAFFDQRCQPIIGAPNEKITIVIIYKRLRGLKTFEHLEEILKVDHAHRNYIITYLNEIATSSDIGWCEVHMHFKTKRQGKYWIYEQKIFKLI